MELTTNTNGGSNMLYKHFTEGCNNKIKVLKRNAYGYRNFKHFRNRILHMFSHQITAFSQMYCNKSSCFSQKLTLFL